MWTKLTNSGKGSGELRLGRVYRSFLLRLLSCSLCFRACAFLYVFRLEMAGQMGNE